MEDYTHFKIKEISRSDIQRIVTDLIEELHMDCSKKIDTDIFGHTVRKVTSLLYETQYRELVWKTVLNITKMGITQSYGAFTRIDYQTFAGWLYKSQPTRSNYAEKSIEEAQSMSNLTTSDFRNISHEWSGFTGWLRENHLLFDENISLDNCNLYQSALRSGSLKDFRDMLVQEHDPECVYTLTLEQARQKHECSEI